MGNTLPEDLIFFEILVRLPLKFLLTLTSVCKRWHFLITNTSIGFHIAHSSYNLHNLPSFLINWQSAVDGVESGFSILNNDYNNVLIRRINDSITTTCKHIFSFYDWPDFDLIDGPENAVSVVGSVHGLICLVQNYVSLYFIWNPITKMLKTVPEPPREFSGMPRFSKSRFCYDPIDKDFKIIEIVSYKMKSELEGGLFRVHVYSCNLGTWKEIRDDSLPNSKFGIAGYFDSKLYVEFLSPWPRITFDFEGAEYGDYSNWEGSLGLVEFDIHDEVFKHLPCPRNTVEGAEYGDYINWKGSLGLAVDTESPDPFVHGPQDVYTFDETRGIWIKQYSAADCLNDYLVYFDLESGDLIVIENRMDHAAGLKLFEAQSDELRDLNNVDGLSLGVMRYMESLVCINGMQHL